MKPVEEPESPDIALRDQDLPFIGTEETFSTHELMELPTIRLFLEGTRSFRTRPASHRCNG